MPIYCLVVKGSWIRTYLSIVCCLPGCLTPRFTCAGATDVVPRHRAPLPGVRCKRWLGHALRRGLAPSRPTPGSRGRPTWGRPSQASFFVLACCLGLLSWPVLPVLVRCLGLSWSAILTCLGRHPLPGALVVGPCREVGVSPCLGGVPHARRA